MTIKRLIAVALPLLLTLAILVMAKSSLWSGITFEISGFVLAAILLLVWGAGRCEIYLHRLLIPLAGLALWPLLQLAAGTSVYAWRTSVTALYWISGLVYFFLALQVFGDAARLSRFLRAILFSGYAISLIAPLQRLFWSDFKLYSMAPFLAANQYAGFVELLLPIAIYAAVADRRYRTWHMAGAGLLYTSVIAAASRAGLAIATAAAMVTIVVIVARAVDRPRRVVTILLRTSILAAILIAAAGPATLFRRFAATDPYSARREYLRSTIAMIRDRPLAGAGLGNWATVYPAYARFDDGVYVNQARNDWAQWTAEGGLPFLALMVLFAFGSLPGAYRTVWGFGIAAVFLHCWVDYVLDRTAMAMLFFTLCGAIAASKSPPEWD